MKLTALQVAERLVRDEPGIDINEEYWSVTWKTMMGCFAWGIAASRQFGEDEVEKIADGLAGDRTVAYNPSSLVRQFNFLTENAKRVRGSEALLLHHSCCFAQTTDAQAAAGRSVAPKTAIAQRVQQECPP